MSASQSLKSVHVFLDTNAALHFRRADSIDWCQLCAAENVSLVAAPIFLRELEYQKVHNNSRKLKARADAYIKWLACFLRDPSREVRPGVTWIFISHEPLIDFPASRLAPSIADDQLIASVISYKPAARPRVFVATDDIGLEVKLRSRNLEVLPLPESFRLPNELEPQEKELQELRRQAALRRSPVLSLSVAGQGSKVCFHVPLQKNVAPAPTLEEILAQNPELSPKKRAESQANQPSGLHRFAAAVEASLYSEERVARYNKDRSEFIAKYEEYLEELLLWEETNALTLRIDLQLANSGSAPATDIDVILTFPMGLLLLQEDDLPQAPRKPQPPMKLGSAGDMSLALMHSSYLSEVKELGLRRMPDIDPSRSLTIESREGCANFWSRGLKHGFNETLDPIFLKFQDREALDSFQVEYSISAAELSDATRGVIHVLLNKGESNA